MSKYSEGLQERNMLIVRKPENVRVRYEDICALPSQIKFVDAILHHLEHGESKVCLNGGFGVGKTTVLKMLNNRVSDGKTIVFWIDCAEEPMDKETSLIASIQGKMMAQLELSEQKKGDIYLDGQMIRDFLKERKYFLLMDHVTIHVDLFRIGISSHHKFGKVIYAPRPMLDTYVMKSSFEVTLQRAPEDALALIKFICDPIHDKRILGIATSMASLSRGELKPLVSVVRRLKKEKNEMVWHTARNAMSGIISDELLFEVSWVENLFNSINESMKKFALHAALFPSSHNIEVGYLIECWIGEGFLPQDNRVYKMRSARNHGMWILKELTKRNILEYTTETCVQMPSLFRKIALEINNTDYGESFIFAKRSYYDQPSEEDWRKARRVSIMENDRTTIASNRQVKTLNLPECPPCNNISTLLLGLNNGLQRIEDGFFDHMGTLHILDLHATSIRSIPPSISVLKNLVTLYLNECDDLSELPIEMRQLVNLETLDIRGTSIQPWLPEVISFMAGLRCLRVSFWGDIISEDQAMTSRKILRKLESLEELMIEVDICSEGWNEICNNIASVVAELKYLTTLSFVFSTVECLETFITRSKSWKNKRTTWGENTFNFFTFFVGCERVCNPFASDVCGLMAQRRLTLSSTQEVPSVIHQVLEQTSAFELIGASNVKSLTKCIFSDKGVLKACVIGDCYNIESIVDVDEIKTSRGLRDETREIDDCILPNLEKLFLYNLPSLQHIWKGTFLTRDFSSFSVLKIRNCPMLTDIVAEIWTRLETIEIVKCRRLKKLFVSRKNAKKLTSILCETNWWKRVKFPDDEEKEHFTRICDFIDQGEARLTIADHFNAG